MEDDIIDINTSNLGASSSKAKMRNCISCPSSIPSTKTRQQVVVSSSSAKNNDWDQQLQEEQLAIYTQGYASTCISFECHPGLLLDDDFLFDDELDDDDTAFDILSILAGQ